MRIPSREHYTRHGRNCHVENRNSVLVTYAMLQPLEAAAFVYSQDGDRATNTFRGSAVLNIHQIINSSDDAFRVPDVWRAIKLGLSRPFVAEHQEIDPSRT